MTEPAGRDAAPIPPVRALRAWRAERLLTIRDLARAAGVAPSTVYLIEAGRTTPRPSVMRRIAALLGVEGHEVVEFRRAVAQHARPRLGGLARHDVLQALTGDRADGGRLLRHASG